MKFNNNKGSTLSLVVIVIAVLTILGTTLLSIGVAEAKQVAYEERKMKAYYIARSAADSVAQYIISNPEESQNILDRIGNGTLAGHVFTVSIGEDTAEIDIEASVDISGAKGTARLILYRVERIENNKVILEYKKGPWQ